MEDGPNGIIQCLYHVCATSTRSIPTPEAFYLSEEGYIFESACFSVITLKLMDVSL